MMVKKIVLSLITFFLICLIVNLSRQIFGLKQASKILESRRREAAIVQKRNEELKKELERVKSQAFVEEEAREKLGMAKEGERLVIPTGKIEPETHLKPTPFRNEDPNWKKWLNVFLE